jgi:hypothetical protein
LAIELSGVRDELRDYLERLGLHVEEGKGGSLLATRRTALAQESLEFRVVEQLPTRFPKNVRFILPPGSDSSKVDSQGLPLDAFLDSTIHADRLAREIVNDPQIANFERERLAQHDHRVQALQEAKAEFDTAWQSHDERLSMSPPKDILSDVNKKFQSGGWKTLSFEALAKGLTKDEVATEVTNVLERIEDALG